MVNVDEFRQPRVILVIRLDHELNHVFRVVQAVEQDRRVSGKGLGQTDVGGVALHQIGIVVGSHQLHGFDLYELEFFRVGRDVFFGGLVTNTFLERDQPGLGQQLQAASAVDRVIGDGHGGAGRQLIEAFVLFRVQTYVVDDPRCVRHQTEASGFVGIGQERDVLKIIHVDIAGSEADVGRDPVGELDQLDLQALLASLFDSGFQRYREGCRGPDFQGFIVSVSGQGQQAEGQCSEGFAHDVVLLKIPKSRSHVLRLSILWERACSRIGQCSRRKQGVWAIAFASKLAPTKTVYNAKCFGVGAHVVINYAGVHPPQRTGPVGAS
ncbi:hypothetical protein ALP69_05485, partial [Pseudomonas syringae pv. aceris]